MRPQDVQPKEFRKRPVSSLKVRGLPNDRPRAVEKVEVSRTRNLDGGGRRERFQVFERWYRRALRAEKVSENERPAPRGPRNNPDAKPLRPKRYRKPSSFRIVYFHFARTKSRILLSRDVILRRLKSRHAMHERKREARPKRRVLAILVEIPTVATAGRPNGIHRFAIHLCDEF